MAWENYALGVLGLAGLEVLVTSAPDTASGTSQVAKLFGNALPNFVDRVIDPTVPFFKTGSTTQTSSKTTQKAQTV